MNDLLHIAHQAMVAGVLPALSGQPRYQALMIARALAIAHRDAQLCGPAEDEERLGIESLIPEVMKTHAQDAESAVRLPEYRRALCAQIRNGRFDAPGPRRDALIAHLAITTENRLRINRGNK